MMIYEIFYHNNSSRVVLGLYQTQEIAQQVCHKINALQEEKAQIKIIDVFDFNPEIFTHIASIDFNDINDVKIEKLQYVTVFDNFVQPQINKESLRPQVCVNALGTSEMDAIEKAKNKMILAIQNGTVQHWKKTMALKTQAMINAIEIAQQKNIEMGADNCPIRQEDFYEWNTIYSSCLNKLVNQM